MGSVSEYVAPGDPRKSIPSPLPAQPVDRLAPGELAPRLAFRLAFRVELRPSSNFWHTAAIRMTSHDSPPIRRVGAYAALFLLAAVGARADGLDPLTSALSETQPLVDLRLRSETLTQTGFSKQAQTLLLRGRLGFRTGALFDTTLLAEASLLTPLVDDYNSGLNGRTAYPSISDPENYELHRLQLDNTSLPDTDLRVGRQLVALDDQRFVGASNWRMNSNTLDSARIINSSIPGLTVDLTWFDRFHRRTTEASSKLGALTGDSYLTNLRYDTPWGRLTAFDYRVSFTETPTLSSQTAGARLVGERTVGAADLSYIASWATQDDYANNPVRYREDYTYVQLKGAVRGYSLSLGTERLGGNGTIGLSTPMASFHSWDGWAGTFTTTPVNGLRNEYLTLGYSTKAAGALPALLAAVTYYDFRSTRLDLHYGSEVDLQLQANWRRFSALVELADYAAADAPRTRSSRSLFLEIDYLLPDKQPL
jgi:hypothetical protein